MAQLTRLGCHSPRECQVWPTGLPLNGKTHFEQGGDEYSQQDSAGSTGRSIFAGDLLERPPVYARHRRDVRASARPLPGPPPRPGPRRGVPVGGGALALPRRRDAGDGRLRGRLPSRVKIVLVSTGHLAGFTREEIHAFVGGTLGPRALGPWMRDGVRLVANSESRALAGLSRQTTSSHPAWFRGTRIDVR